jgi:two-component system phosphate regulon response regulator OmpR
MNEHILVVDDDPVVRNLIQQYLEANGLAVSVLNDAVQLRQRIQDHRPSLVVMDVMMPGLDGLSALRDLRASGEEIPVIFLSARAETVDRVIGLELGADDYLAKPFEPRELFARIRTGLRRRGGPISSAPESRPPFRFGRFQVDFTSRALYRDGERISLTSSEFALLKTFINHPMTVINRTHLFEKLHGQRGNDPHRSLDVSIWRIRRRIELDPSEPHYIQTVWGKGYIFVPSGEVGIAERYAEAEV